MVFNCIYCGQSLDADADMAGTSVTCPACSKDLTVPFPKDQAIKIRRTVPPPVPEQPISGVPPLNTGLMAPRSYFGTALMLFGATALPFGLLMGWLMSALTGTSFGAMLVLAVPGGLMFGLLVGFISAAFLKGDTITIGVPDRDEFISRLNIGMSQIGFNPATASGNFLTFKPSFQAGLMAGRMSVVIHGSRATVVGPSMYLKKLRKRLG